MKATTLDLALRWISTIAAVVAGALWCRAAGRALTNREFLNAQAATFTALALTAQGLSLLIHLVAN